jgi:hypothetical protein
VIYPVLVSAETEKTKENENKIENTNIKEIILLIILLCILLTSFKIFVYILPNKSQIVKLDKFTNKIKFS